MSRFANIPDDIDQRRSFTNLAKWREDVNSTFVPLQIDEYAGMTFRGHMERTIVGDVSVFEIVATPHIVNRTAELIEKVEGRFYKLSLQLAGPAELRQDGRTVNLAPGDIAIYDTHRPYRLTYREKVRSMVIMFPHEAVDLPPDEVAQVTAVGFPYGEGLGRVINPFFIELGRNLDELSGPHASRLVHSALDLLVTMLSQELRRSREGKNDPARSLAREVREYILAHLSDPSMTPERIAHAHYISTRHLYTIFSSEGATISAWIRQRRLEYIRRDLADPVHADRPVSSIASRWGLVDAAHFSRAFKNEFGVSPGLYRSQASQSGAQAAGEESP